MYTTPVNYVANHDSITIFSQRNRVWWKNLRGGAPVTLRIRGQNLEAIGESLEDAEDVTAGLLAYLQKFPRYAKYFKVALDADGQPDPEEVAKAAQNRVLIRVRPTRTLVT